MLKKMPLLIHSPEVERVQKCRTYNVKVFCISFPEKTSIYNLTYVFPRPERTNIR